MTIKNNKKGFTLVELLVAMTMTVLILIGAYTIYIMTTKIYRSNSETADLTQNARIALERMSREVRQNVEILTPLPLDPTSGTPARELAFQDGHNFWPSSGKVQYIRYYLSGTDLHREAYHYAFLPGLPDDWVLYSTRNEHNESPSKVVDSDQIKANRVSSLQFWGDKTVTIKIGVSNNENNFEFQTNALGRNIE